MTTPTPGARFRVVVPAPGYYGVEDTETGVVWPYGSSEALAAQEAAKANKDPRHMRNRTVAAPPEEVTDGPA